MNSSKWNRSQVDEQQKNTMMMKPAKKEIARTRGKDWA